MLIRGSTTVGRMSSRKYRAKIEILRAVLAAAREGEKKTRIMGLANLNWSSLDKYLTYCVDHGLLLQNNGGYQFTPRGQHALGVIDVILARGSELHDALHEFVQLAGIPPVAPGDSAGGLPLLVTREQDPVAHRWTGGPTLQAYRRAPRNRR